MNFEHPEDSKNFNNEIIEKKNESKEGAPVELTIQYGGYPCEALVWVTSEAGENPPRRIWRAPACDGNDAIQKALKDLGLDSAHVVEMPDMDELDEDFPNKDLGIIALNKEND